MLLLDVIQKPPLYVRRQRRGHSLFFCSVRHWRT
jgi:hypothetical protein